METVEAALLGATGGRPAVEFISGDGEKLALPVGLDDRYAFDYALARVGWVAVQIGEQVAALRDGNLLRPTRLPDVWFLLPAADPRLVVISRHVEREGGKECVFELVDADGAVLKSVQAPVWRAVGETRTGFLVTSDGLLSWDGSVEPLPFEGQPGAVLAGRHVLISDDSGLVLIDLETKARATCPFPSGDDWMLIAETFNATATAVAYAQSRFDQVFVATESLGPRWLEVGFPQDSAVWLDDHQLLLVGDRANCVLDVRSGSRDRLPRLPRSAHPRVTVTGRFDPEQLRAALRPPWDGPIPKATARKLLEESEQRARHAAREVGLPDQALSDARPAIRLRSCLAPKRVRVGASRFGGRPDLPRGHRWPRSSSGEPMAFLAQFRLDEIKAALPARRLPASGLLVVFAEIEAEMGAPDSAYVEIVPSEGLRRMAWPPDLAEEIRYEPSLAVAEPTLSVSDWPELDADAPQDRARQFRELIARPGPDHRLFGHPSSIQGHGSLAGYELLLQLDSDPMTGMTFGDGGRIHIWCPIDAHWSGEIQNCEIDVDSY